MLIFNNILFVEMKINVECIHLFKQMSKSYQGKILYTNWQPSQRHE